MKIKKLSVVTAISAMIATAIVGVASAQASMNMPAGQTMYPLRINNCGTNVVFKKAPSRVILMNGASVGEVEDFVALGLQNKILGNSQSYGVSDDPTMVAKIAAIPTDGLKVNQTTDDISEEQILSRKPDLVISTWFGGFTKANGFKSRSDLTKLGINSLINPTNCDLGNANPTSAEKSIFVNQGIDSSYGFISMLGQIFNVQNRAHALIASIKSQIAQVQAKVSKETPLKALVVYPDMGMMNANGLPAVFVGGIYNSVLKAAGLQNVFTDSPTNFNENVNQEILSSINPDIVVLGSYVAGEDLNSEIAALFKAYPQWNAAKNNKYVSITDSIYLGPLNGIAVAKIAKAAYPSDF